MAYCRKTERRTPILDKMGGRTLFSFILPYALFLILIFVIGIINRNISVNTTIDQLERTFKFTLDQLQSKVDYSIRQITTPVSDYTYSKRISALTNGTGELTPTEIYTNIDLQNDLLGVIQSSPSTQYIGIYFTDRDFLLGTTATYRSPDLGFWSELYYGKNFTDFRSQYLETYQKGDLYICDTDTDRPYLLYVKTVAINHSTGNYTHLVMKADPSELIESFIALEQSIESPIYLVQNNGAERSYLTSSLKPVSYDKLNLLDEFYLSPEGEVTVDSKPYMITKLPLNQIGSDLLVPIPLSVYMSDADMVGRSILLYTFAFTLIGIAISAFFSYRSYTPYRRLITLLKETPATTNPHAHIERSLYRLLRENRDLSDKLRISDEFKRSTFLEKLTKGEISKDAIQHSLSHYELNFTGENVIVCGFAVADAGKNFGDDDVTSGLLSFSVSNAFQELMGDEADYYFTTSEDINYCVFSVVSAKLKDTEKRIKSAAKELNLFFREQLDVSLIISMSSTHQGIDSISHAYTESSYELRHRLRQRTLSDDIFPYIDRRSEGKVVVSEDNNSNQAIQADEDPIIKIVIDYLNDNFTDPDLSAGTTAIRLNYNRSYLSHLFKQRTGVGLMEYISKLRFERAKTLLSDQNLDLSEVAELSGYYDTRPLYQVFKKYTGLPPSKWRQQYGSIQK